MAGWRGHPGTSPRGENSVTRRMGSSRAMRVVENPFSKSSTAFWSASLPSTLSTWEKVSRVAKTLSWELPTPGQVGIELLCSLPPLGQQVVAGLGELVVLRPFFGNSGFDMVAVVVLIVVKGGFGGIVEIGKELVIFFLANGVVFMSVAPRQLSVGRARPSQSSPFGRSCSWLGISGNRPAFLGGVHPDEAGGDVLFEGRVGKDTGDLPDQEVVQGEVFVEGSDDPVYRVMPRLLSRWRPWVSP